MCLYIDMNVVCKLEHTCTYIHMYVLKGMTKVEVLHIYTHYMHT